MRRLLIVGTLVASMGGLFFAPPAFANEEVSGVNDPCAAEVIAVADRGQVDSSQELDFVCSGSTLTIFESTVGNPDGLGTADESEPLYQGDVPLDATSRQGGAYCTASGVPEYNIIDPFVAETYFCIIYGRMVDGNVLWSEAMSVILTTTPQWSWQGWELRAYSSSNPEFGGVMWLRHNQGILVSKISSEAFQGFTSPSFNDWGYLPTYELGVYSLLVDDMYVTDSAHNFSAPVSAGPEATSPRFSCEVMNVEYEQCWFPNGEEAPWA